VSVGLVLIAVVYAVAGVMTARVVRRVEGDDLGPVEALCVVYFWPLAVLAGACWLAARAAAAVVNHERNR
jgi:hypothetical protein